MTVNGVPRCPWCKSEMVEQHYDDSDQRGKLIRAVWVCPRCETERVGGALYREPAVTKEDRSLR